ncbi:cobalt-zinc-cadmium efflux system outer membrane protein [Catalinimonas alkaloidigena]|nr:cobalt-zinc-cadmium efflux system outer membrane protein [Catalinimonas alkaloidigena]
MINASYAMKKYCFFIILLTIIFGLNRKVEAQNTVEEVLRAVEQNNPTLQARRQYVEAQALSFKTDIYLPNPMLAFEYLPGTPAEAGTQKDLTVSQAFDFPSVYFRKKDLAEAQINQLSFVLDSLRQQVLLEAKLLCLELIYARKQQAVFNQRLSNAEQLVRDYGRRLAQGNANILEVNKAKLLRLNLNNELIVLESQIVQMTEKLTALNGGEEMLFTADNYPEMDNIPEFEVLEPLTEANDPTLNYYEQQQEVSQEQLSVNRALVLPSFQAGYRYQAILGQQYNGFMAGISIPLWEDKNKIKLAQAQINWSNQAVARERTEHLYTIRRLYEKQQTLQNTLQEYEGLLSELNNTALLEKALRLGEISSIEFFMEIMYFYEAEDKYLRLENEYQQAVAELLKYQL